MFIRKYQLYNFVSLSSQKNILTIVRSNFDILPHYNTISIDYNMPINRQNFNGFLGFLLLSLNKVNI